MNLLQYRSLSRR